MKDDVRIRAEALWEELGGDLCICQQPDVPHWCERCQQHIDTIMAFDALSVEEADASHLNKGMEDDHCEGCITAMWCSRAGQCLAVVVPVDPVEQVSAALGREGAAGVPDAVQSPADDGPPVRIAEETARSRHPRRSPVAPDPLRESPVSLPDPVREE